MWQLTKTCSDTWHDNHYLQQQQQQKTSSGYWHTVHLYAKLQVHIALQAIALCSIVKSNPFKKQTKNTRLPCAVSSRLVPRTGTVYIYIYMPQAEAFF